MMTVDSTAWPDLGPGSPVDAVIFDLDGVLIDSEPLHQRALTSVLAARGHRLTDEEYFPLIGVTEAATWEILAARFHLQGDLSEYASAYRSEVLRLLRGPLTPQPGAVELVGYCRRRGLKLGLASSSSSAWVAAELSGLGLAGAFDVVVSGDRVARGKPDPEIFLVAAATLGVAPDRALVIEDSLPGIEAARRAGMRVVAVRTPYTAGRLLPADRVVDSLADLLS